MASAKEFMTVVFDLEGGKVHAIHPDGSQEILREKKKALFAMQRDLDEAIRYNNSIMNKLYAEGWRLITTAIYAQSYQLFYLERPSEQGA
jgi:hypothetical protein